VVRFLPFLIAVALAVYALFSCVQTRAKDVPYLPKLVWLVLIVFMPFVGPVAWLLVSRTQGPQSRPAPAGGRPASRPPIRPVAPDDDPDFLASLESYRDPRLSDRLTDRPKDRGKAGPEKQHPKDKRPEPSADSSAESSSDESKPDNQPEPGEGDSTR
jgi:phospholipase D-like protein